MPRLGYGLVEIVMLGLFALSHARLPRPWSMPLFPRLAMQAYFLVAGVVLGIFQRLPLLLAVSLSMLVLELCVRLAVRPAPVQPMRMVPELRNRIKN